MAADPNETPPGAPLGTLPTPRMGAAGTNLRPMPPPLQPAHLSAVPSVQQGRETQIDARYLPLPQFSEKRSRATLYSFLICVVLPLICVAAYFTFLASDQYIAEFRFSVTENDQNGINPQAGSSSSSSSPLASLSSMLGGGSISNASMQNYVVTDYLQSRQAVEELQKRVDIKAIYGKPTSDIWARFDPSRPMETFLAYWKSMVYATYDPVTGIASVEVRAFTPDDAYLIANNMVEMSETLVNDIAMRTQRDAVRYAAKEVDDARSRLQDLSGQLAAFRAKEGIVDPTSNTVSSNSDLAKQLRTNLTQMQTELASLSSMSIDRNSPTVTVLKSRIAATQGQLAKVTAQVGQDSNGNTALAAVMSKYEQLQLDYQYAQSFVNIAMQTYDQARANAASQRLYLTPYVRPSKPESPEAPRRVLSIMVAGLVLLGLWMVGLFVVRSILDHDL